MTKKSPGQSETRVLESFEDQDFPLEQSIKNKLLTLSVENSHHIRNVLRKNIGDSITVLNQLSRRSYQTSISKLDPLVELNIIAENNKPAMGSKVRTLICAILKGDKNELVTEKACELGVERIFFWQARHSVSKINSNSDRNKKQERWQKIANAAARQSGNTSPSIVEIYDSLENLISKLDQSSEKNCLRLCCSLKKEARSLKELTGETESLFEIIIGPEGDFSSEELEQLKIAGFLMLNLGPLILRAETAAIACIAGLNMSLGHRTL